jgi:predicted ATP-dependent endonuclease of OLD family
LSEKLIIKNFGPIKSVELELKKVTVLIGEQGTGKSALAKLLYVLSNYFFLFGNDDERKTIIESYGLFFRPDTEINYNTDYYSVTCQFGKFAIELKDDVKKAYENIKEKPNSILIDWFDKLISDYIYVPAERIALTPIVRMLNAPSRTLYRGSFDEFIVDFAQDYDTARRKIHEYVIPHLNNVVFKMVNGLEKVVFNNEELFLDQTSSGFQVSIPFVVLMAYYIQIKSINKFIIEEPELNLFPTAQYELIKFFIEKVNPINSSVLVTTHSPYILTSLNNLIQAYLTGNKRGRKQKTTDIIPHKYWLNLKDVTAYMLKYDDAAKGVVHENILDEDGLIKAEKIDGVSRILNEEFDKLLNIEFGIKK